MLQKVIGMMLDSIFVTLKHCDEMFIARELLKKTWYLYDFDVKYFVQSYKKSVLEKQSR